MQGSDSEQVVLMMDQDAMESSEEDCTSWAPADCELDSKVSSWWGGGKEGPQAKNKASGWGGGCKCIRLQVISG